MKKASELWWEAYLATLPGAFVYAASFNDVMIKAGIGKTNRDSEEFSKKMIQMSLGMVASLARTMADDAAKEFKEKFPEEWTQV